MLPRIRCIALDGIRAIGARPSFTEEQVERGRAAYNQNCQDCRGSTSTMANSADLSRAAISATTGGRQRRGFDRLRQALMPPDVRAGCPTRPHTDLVAFL
jgi:hypothetical protein